MSLPFKLKPHLTINHWVTPLFFLCYVGIVYGQHNNGDAKTIDIDYIADGRLSHYNFTDRVKPYNGFDIWGEAKASYWLGKEKIFAPYLSLNGSYMLASKSFDWQKYIQGSVGAQLYLHPVFFEEDQARLLRGVRFFALAGYRLYFEKNSNPFSDFEERDLQVGMDYYYDNLFQDSWYNIFAWTNATYRFTNFSHEGYKNVLWSGNIKAGINLRKFAKIQKRSFWIPYVTADWSYADSCPCRWWENYLRAGAGIRYYPWSYAKDPNHLTSSRFLQRFNIYAEVLSKVTELNLPEYTEVKDWDIRIGISFATSGILRTGK